MGKPKRALQATVEQTAAPPAALEDGQVVARVVSAAGNNLWTVELPSTLNQKQEMNKPRSSAPAIVLVELPSRFRSFIWLKRGGYVIMDTKAFDSRENKIAGEIINVVRDEKLWRKQAYWPQAFSKAAVASARHDGESIYDSRVGQMPPSADSEVDE